MSYTWLFVVSLALVGATYAFEEDCCSAEDKKEIAFQWHAIWHSGYTDRKVRVMKAVWHDIVAKHPAAVELMKAKGITSEDTPEFRAYVIKVVHGLDMIVNMLDEPLVLEEQLSHMAERFAGKVGLKKSYFEAVVDSLESVLPKVSGCFNVGAWHRCLNRLASSISEKVPAAA